MLKKQDEIVKKQDSMLKSINLIDYKYLLKIKDIKDIRIKVDRRKLIHSDKI